MTSTPQAYAPADGSAVDVIDSAIQTNDSITYVKSICPTNITKEVEPLVTENPSSKSINKSLSDNSKKKLCRILLHRKFQSRGSLLPSLRSKVYSKEVHAKRNQENLKKQFGIQYQIQYHLINLF
ncbi:alaS [Acrasis kona]|uniref:AlaS n=1 Tax=Acrasis kona TaxID=1008807 RepID=A0AAW2ZA11_9EUKA